MMAMTDTARELHDSIGQLTRRICLIRAAVVDCDDGWLRLRLRARAARLMHEGETLCAQFRAQHKEDAS